MKMAFVDGSNPDGWEMSVSANGTLDGVVHKSNGGPYIFLAAMERL
jgi:hypothetical protein